MISLQLTEIADTGYLNPLHAHVSISLSKTLILFVGGKDRDHILSNKVKIFDAEKREWRDEEPFLSKLGLGLGDHRAIGFPRKDGVSIICLGGFSNISKHPSYMVVFNATFH